MNFTLNKDKVVCSTRGHAIEFKKGVPTHVPQEMWADVQAIGATPTEDLPEAVVEESGAPQDPAERKAAVFAAFNAMVLADARDDFMGTGTPNIKQLCKRLKFDIDAKERDTLWAEFKLIGKDD